MSRPTLSSRLEGFGTTVFTEMTRLALEHDAINLGQGFPDFPGFSVARDAAISALKAEHNQYARMAGVPELTRAVAAHGRRFHGLDYDAENEVTVMSGATEAIFASLQGLLNDGDEVVLFEPFYDSYLASVAMAGAKSRVVTLHAPDFRYRTRELEAAITDRTRVLLLNTPNNPTGRVFDRGELEQIAALSQRHDLVVISDEVYEHIVFDAAHVSIATLPGMRERTIRISSTGKTFSMTGWKIGWACAPEALTRAVRTAHQFITFCSATPLQHAMGHALAAGDEFFDELRRGYLERRDHLCAGLAAAGFDVRPPQGTYFVLADIRPLGYDDDVAFCRMLPEKIGVAAVPPTAFYVNKEEGRHLVRFAFAKKLETLDEAVRRLATLRR